MPQDSFHWHSITCLNDSQVSTIVGAAAARIGCNGTCNSMTGLGATGRAMLFFFLSPAKPRFMAQRSPHRRPYHEQQTKRLSPPTRFGVMAVNAPYSATPDFREVLYLTNLAGLRHCPAPTQWFLMIAIWFGAMGRKPFRGRLGQGPERLWSNWDFPPQKPSKTCKAKPEGWSVCRSRRRFQDV